MHAFDILGDPVRRRILELLAAGEHASGAIVEVIQAEFGISQPAVSQHLKALRDSGFTSVRVDGPRRLYSIEPAPLREIDAWLARFRSFWEHKLEALATEVARGKRRDGARGSGSDAVPRPGVRSQGAKRGRADS
jgi:DNA-binding transcriptional ArsR family regulator